MCRILRAAMAIAAKLLLSLISLTAAAALEDELGMMARLIFDIPKSTARQSTVTPKQSWCIAKSSVDDSSLQSALNYACGQTTADCNPIKLGGQCFLPNTIVHHASYVFNSYYQMNAKASGTCSFSDAATVTTENPSSGTCEFPSSGSLNQSTRVVENDASRRLSRGAYALPIAYLLAYTIL